MGSHSEQPVVFELASCDGPSVGWFPDQRKIGMFLLCPVPMVC